jgi:hypothetical protein
MPARLLPAMPTRACKRRHARNAGPVQDRTYECSLSPACVAGLFAVAGCATNFAIRFAQQNRACAAGCSQLAKAGAPSLAHRLVEGRLLGSRMSSSIYAAASQRGHDAGWQARHQDLRQDGHGAWLAVSVRWRRSSQTRRVRSRPRPWSIGGSSARRTAECQSSRTSRSPFRRLIRTS